VLLLSSLYHCLYAPFNIVVFFVIWTIRKFCVYIDCVWIWSKYEKVMIAILHMIWSPTEFFIGFCAPSVVCLLERFLCLYSLIQRSDLREGRIRESGPFLIKIDNIWYFVYHTWSNPYIRIFVQWKREWNPRNLVTTNFYIDFGTMVAVFSRKPFLNFFVWYFVYA